jgi:ABC-type glutathione transport system ATPase component
MSMISGGSAPQHWTSGVFIVGPKAPKYARGMGFIPVSTFAEAMEGAEKIVGNNPRILCTPECFSGGCLSIFGSSEIRKEIMAEVKLVHVTKKFGKVQAVDDFTLHIKDGEFLILVGPSGCGKSTVLRSIAGLEEISSGEIYIGDRLVNDVHPKDRDIAMVFQNYALYPHMDVYQNMAFSLRQKKIPKNDIDRVVMNSARLWGLKNCLTGSRASCPAVNAKGCGRESHREKPAGVFVR